MRKKKTKPARRKPVKRKVSQVTKVKQRQYRPLPELRKLYPSLHVILDVKKEGSWYTAKTKYGEHQFCNPEFVHHDKDAILLQIGPTLFLFDNTKFEEWFGIPYANSTVKTTMVRYSQTTKETK